MEDDKLKKIFEDFNPQLSDDGDFLNELTRRMESVELVKEHNDAVRSRGRKAFVIAATVGFLSGVLFTILFSLLIDSAFSFTVGSLAITLRHGVISWIIVAGVSVVCALNAYEAAMSHTAASNKHE